MSIMGRRVSLRTVLLVAVALIVVSLIPVMTRTRPEAAREIQLVVRDMSFYLAEDPRASNPTIRVKRGEAIRLVLRNDDRGFTHDFSLPASSARTRALSWNEQDEVTFIAPATPGTYEYICQPHRGMMRGQIVVLP